MKYFRGKIIGRNINSVRCEINPIELTQGEFTNIEQSGEYEFSGWIKEIYESERGLTHTIPVKASFKLEPKAANDSLSLLRKDVILCIDASGIITRLIPVTQAHMVALRSAKLWTQWESMR